MLHILSDDFSAFPFGDAIEKAVVERRPAILLVPEQMALATERGLAARLPSFAPLYFEVSNFSRLADRVFRTEGGISYQYADHAAEIILMWKVLDAAAPLLKNAKKSSTDTVKEGLAALSEITAAGVRPRDLLSAATALTEKPALASKLSDLALLTELYEGERDAIYGSLATDLDKLLAILEEKPLFADTEIYVSGFTSFTARELAVLKALMRQGSVSVSLPLPAKDAHMLSYEEVAATRKALCEAADGRLDEACATRTDRPAMLEYAKHMLFRADGDLTPYEGDTDGALSLTLSKDPYTGASSVAAKIAAAVRAGARYRDFTVVTRAPEKYDGILDDALLSEGIPFYFAKQTDITELSLSKMILSAYASIDRGFARADLLAYLKCGFSGVSRDDGDLFELYAERWNLKGAAFTDGIPFDMHPRGYESAFSEEERHALDRINLAREQLVSPLLELKKATDGVRSAREHATALYRFLEGLRVPALLDARAAQERAVGRTAEAARLSRLFSVLCELLDRVVRILADTSLSRSSFTELLSLLFTSVSLETIPTLSDAVTVCNADTFRPSTEKEIILFGAVEGEFPAAVGLGGVFPEEERCLLEKHDVKIGKPPEVKASREQFSFLRALVSAERATVVSFESDAFGAALRPSSAYLKLSKLFPNAVTHSRAEEVFSPQAAAERLFEKRGTAEGAAIARLLAEDPAFARAANAAQIPLFDPEVTVSEKNAALLFPDHMRSSQSQIENYLDCPFAFYCKRALRLAEQERAAIRPLEVGNILHAILEKLFAFLAEDGTDIRHTDPSRIPAYVDRALREYVSALFPKTMQASPRLTHLLARMRRAAILVCEDLYDEFAASAFTPTFCELDLQKEKGGPGMLVFKDGDGKTVRIGGRIDRVDTYRAENGELFVRVVDYKTGSHTFSREKVKKARDLQMFLYLCAIWKTESEEFLHRLSLKDGEQPLPAGIVYNTANPKTTALSYPVSEEALSARIQKELLHREGFFLAEEEVLRAMDDRLPHMAYAESAKGGYKTENKKLFGSLVEFGELLDDAERAVLDVARQMRSGRADIAPDRENERCADCAFRTVCRNEDFKTKAY